jgi:hypothetical protein
MSGIGWGLQAQVDRISLRPGARARDTISVAVYCQMPYRIVSVVVYCACQHVWYCHSTVLMS